MSADRLADLSSPLLPRTSLRCDRRCSQTFTLYKARQICISLYACQVLANAAKVLSAAPPFTSQLSAENDCSTPKMELNSGDNVF